MPDQIDEGFVVENCLECKEDTLKIVVEEPPHRDQSAASSRTIPSMERKSVQHQPNSSDTAGSYSVHEQPSAILGDSTQDIQTNLGPTQDHSARFSNGESIPLDGKFHVDPSNPMRSVRYLKAWSPPGVLQVFSGGNTARLGSLPDGSVLKFPFDKDDIFTRKALNIEHSILSALRGHQRLVRYLGEDKDGLRFEFAANGDVRRYISAQEPGTISLQLRQKWVKQAVECLVFVHSKGVIHCDIHPNNFLLDGQLDLQICDFSGSLFGELDGAAMESTRYFLPRDPLSTPNVRTDLFALGSAMYYIMTGYDPYNALSDDEVTFRYSEGVFPDVTGITNGDVILGCWTGRFTTAQEVEEIISCQN